MSKFGEAGEQAIFDGPELDGGPLRGAAALRVGGEAHDQFGREEPLEHGDDVVETHASAGQRRDPLDDMRFAEPRLRGAQPGRRVHQGREDLAGQTVAPAVRAGGRSPGRPRHGRAAGPPLGPPRPIAGGAARVWRTCPWPGGSRAMPGRRRACRARLESCTISPAASRWVSMATVRFEKARSWSRLNPTISRQPLRSGPHATPSRWVRSRSRWLRNTVPVALPQVCSGSASNATCCPSARRTMLGIRQWTCNWGSPARLVR